MLSVQNTQLQILNVNSYCYKTNFYASNDYWENVQTPRSP